jgi:hypothetical protein
MPNENEGSNLPGDSPPPPPPLATSPQQMGEPAQTVIARQNEEAPASKRELHVLEKINIFGQLGLVVIGIAAASIYGCQLHTMNGQLAEMKGSGEQTNRLLCLYQRQLEQITKQATDTHDLAVAAGNQATASGTQAGASLRSAKAQEIANGVVADQFALAQRPWIQADTKMSIYQPPDATGKPTGHQPPDLNGDPDQIIIENRSVTFTVAFANIGHSPALHESHSTRVDFVPFHGTMASGMADVPIPTLKDCKPDAVRPKSELVIFPDKPYQLQVANIIALENEVGEWHQLRRVIFAQGCIKYDDELGKSHQTNFCSYLTLGEFPHAWRTCGMNNSAW